MKYTKHFFAIYIALLFSGLVNAQNTFPIMMMNIQRIPVANDTSGGLPDLSDSTIFNVKMKIVICDTTVIDKFYVALNNSDTTVNRLQHTFDWDVTGLTGDGTSYLRAGYNVILDLGDYKNLLNYTASVRIKRVDGTYTNFINFSR